MPPAVGAASTGDIPPGIRAELSAEQRREARRALTVLAVLGSGSIFGVASSLYLVNHYPLLLIALSPIGRHMVLVAPTVDPIAFVAVGVARRMLFYAACFHLGGALGEAAVEWLEARAAWAARFVRWLERLFARASRTVVLCMPGPTVAVIAGSSGMRLPVFLALAAVGTALRMLLYVGFAEMIREPVEALLVWIDRYWIPGTAVLVVGILFYRWRFRAPVVP